MSNPWINHLKQVRQANPKLSYKECMVKGKLSYKKKQKGGLYVSPEIPKNLSRMKPLTNAQIAQLGGSVYVPSAMPKNLSRMKLKPLTKAQLAQFGMGVGYTAESIWNGIKKIGKVVAIGSLAIPATALASQIAFMAFLKMQPDGGVSMINTIGSGITQIVMEDAKEAVKNRQENKRRG